MSYKSRLERSRPGGLAKDLAARQAFSTDEATLKNIVTPTLIIRGASDLLTPLKADRAVANMIDGAQMTTLENSGHAMMQVAPGEVLDALKKFIKL